MREAIDMLLGCLRTPGIVYKCESTGAYFLFYIHQPTHKHVFTHTVTSSKYLWKYLVLNEKAM